MTYKRLISFDFDDTMCHTPKPEEGKIIWKEKTGTEWPYGGWWGRAESINPEVFDIQVNPWVYKKYLEAVSDPDNYVILATGRLRKVPNMLNHVETILNKHNISFDEIHLNWGGDTYNFKTKLFEQKIEELGVHEFVMYDDRSEHLVRFEEWAEEHHIDVTVVDVVNKKETNYPNNI
jgi:hypothetical protein